MSAGEPTMAIFDDLDAIVAHGGFAVRAPAQLLLLDGLVIAARSTDIAIRIGAAIDARTLREPLRPQT
jgi:hypothetical protein